MFEYIGDALVLNKIPNNDLDARISVFSQKFGKIIAKAKSIRKITSKLSGHFQPGNLVKIRLIEKNGWQIVDGLKYDFLPVSPMNLEYLDRVLVVEQPEPSLWRLIEKKQFDWLKILKILGWDPVLASCAVCQKQQAAYFATDNQDFFCSKCASLNVKNLLLLKP